MQPLNNYMYFIVLLFFIAGVSYLVYTGFSENSVYFLNVTEALTMPNDKLKSVRLFGTVAQKDLIYSEDKRSVYFKIQDNDDHSKTIPVKYTGVLPDTFRSGAEVIIEGALLPEGVFQANTLMTKCPSRYENENYEMENKTVLQ